MVILADSSGHCNFVKIEDREKIFYFRTYQA